MFQREVARRIVATPAERADYGRLAVLAGWRTEARILFDVAPAAFTPAPKVTSSLIELIPRAAPEPMRRGDPLGADPGRVRPAAQDAAPVAESLRRGPRPRPSSAPRRCRDRTDDAGGGGRRCRVRGAGSGGRRMRCRNPRTSTVLLGQRTISKPSEGKQRISGRRCKAGREGNASPSGRKAKARRKESQQLFF